jgi:hypothetical protein
LQIIASIAEFGVSRTFADISENPNFCHGRTQTCCMSGPDMDLTPNIVLKFMKIINIFGIALSILENIEWAGYKDEQVLLFCTTTLEKEQCSSNTRKMCLIKVCALLLRAFQIEI